MFSSFFFFLRREVWVGFENDGTIALTLLPSRESFASLMLMAWLHQPIRVMAPSPTAARPYSSNSSSSDARSQSIRSDWVVVRAAAMPAYWIWGRARQKDDTRSGDENQGSRAAAAPVARQCGATLQRPDPHYMAQCARITMPAMRRQTRRGGLAGPASACTTRRRESRPRTLRHFDVSNPA